MKETHNIKHPSDPNDEIDFRESIEVLIQGKRIIAYMIAFTSIVGIIFSLLSPNIYESKALLVPVNSSSGISGALKSYGGLEGLAGISLPGSSDEDNSSKAIKKITTLSFFADNVLNNIFLPDLMAVKSWNPKTNTLVYDEKIYKMNSNSWVRKYRYPQKLIPSAQESFEVFTNEILSLSEDVNSGFITLSIKHQSPFLAKQWAELVINEINSFYRKKDKEESEKAVNYLNQQISMTGLSEIKQVIAQLLQEETKKLALIEANQFYVFDYIDPPAVMEEKSGPRRVFIIILSIFFGAMLGILSVLIRYYVFREKVA